MHVSRVALAAAMLVAAVPAMAQSDDHTRVMQSWGGVPAQATPPHPQHFLNQALADLLNSGWKIVAGTMSPRGGPAVIVLKENAYALCELGGLPKPDCVALN